MTRTSIKKSYSELPILVILGIIVIVAIGGYLFAYNYLATIKTKNSELEESIANVNSSLLETNDLKEVIARTQEDRDQINSYFVTPDTINRFFEELEGIGETIGVDVTLESAQEQTGSTNKKQLLVVLQSEGSFQDIYAFLLMLENLPFEITITSVELRLGGLIEASPLPESPVIIEGVGPIRPTQNIIEASPLPEYFWEGNFTLVLESFVDTPKEN